MNTKRKGGIGLVKAIGYFTELGKTCLLPVIDCDKYDLVIDNDKFVRIQCKYTNERANRNSFVVDLRTFGGYKNRVRYTIYGKDDFDFLFIYCNNGDKFLIPINKILGKSQITVSNRVGSPWYKYLIQLQAK